MPQHDDPVDEAGEGGHVHIQVPLVHHLLHLLQLLRLFHLAGLKILDQLNYALNIILRVVLNPYTAPETHPHL